MVGWEGKDKIGWLILAIWIVKMEGNTAGQVFMDKEGSSPFHFETKSLRLRIEI